MTHDTTPKRTTTPGWDDAMFHAIANSRRRLAILFVDLQGSTSLSALAEYVASAEYDKPPEHLSARERKRVYIALKQDHLGRLADVGLIETDDRGGHAIEATDLTSAVAEYVRLGVGRFADVSPGLAATDDDLVEAAG